MTAPLPLVTLSGLSKHFGTKPPKAALEAISATLRTGCITGLVGPDGAGKTTLIRLMAGLLRPTAGRLSVDGHDSVRDAAAIQAMIGYMPQRFGLYEDLTVQENLNLYADLQGLGPAERGPVFARLLHFTDLDAFTTRLAGALSGGMKQKLGLACTLLRKPRLLLLDEPSVGVDPISRRELWRMVKGLLDADTGVVWSTSYLDEAEQCEEVLLLNEGHLLFAGPPQDLTRRMVGRSFRLSGLEPLGRRALLATVLDQPGIIDGVVMGDSLRLVTAVGADAPSPQALGVGAGGTLSPTAPRFEDAFIDILGGGPSGHSALAALRTQVPDDGQPAIEAKALTRRFGAFTAANRITFAVPRGEIFGLLGPNGAGKSTTFKMLCGLLAPSEGLGRVAGFDLASAGALARAQIGYMAQKFSLYGALSVRQNLQFFASVYGLGRRARSQQIERMIDTFAFGPIIETSAETLPLGFKQRLALACAVMHEPQILFLDEPTSGVDPLTRREFWTHINGMVEKGVTIMVTTHFMDEAEYCDRIALIYRGQTIAIGSPDDLKAQVRGTSCPDPTLEDAFITLVERSDAAAAARGVAA